MSGFLWRRLTADDDGISLVEVLVGIMIIGIALGAFAGTLTQALANITRDEQFVRGNQLAADEVEGLRTIHFDAIGFYEDDPGYQPTGADGAPTVVLGPTRPPGAVAPLPQPPPIDRDGISYQPTYEVVWIDDPAVTIPAGTAPGEDYKELRIRLEWTVRDRSFETQSATVRRPTLEERPLDPAPPCTPGDIVSFDIAPNFVEISPSGHTQQAVLVTVVTCEPADLVVLDPDPLSTRNMTSDPDFDGTVFRIADFPRGTPQFSPGEFTWTATATSSHGSVSETAEVRFVQQGTELLEVIDLQLAPSAPICTRPTSGSNNRATWAPVTLTATVTGAGEGDAVVFAWTDRAGTASGGWLGTDVSGNGRYTATIPADHNFRSETTTISVSVTRVTSDSLRVTESYVVPIARTASQASCP